MDFKHYMNNFYELEAQQSDEEAYEEIKNVSVSFKVSIETAALLNVVAKRMGTSRHAFGGEILDAAAQELFFALSDEDREKLSALADKEITDYMLKNECQVESIGALGHLKDEWRPWAERVAIEAALKRAAEKEGDK